jgi:hypothetical protein
MADNQVDLKLNLDFKGVNDALYQMIGDFKGTDKEFEKIAASIQKNANKLEASILVFGPASKQAAASQKALQDNMVSLVANGVNPEIAAIATLSQNYNSLNGILGVTEQSNNKVKTSFNNSENSVKQSNKQYTALALVLQDLPYGFRGIQNNLPALFGSIATGTGIAYVAFSALVAAITAVDMGLIKFGNTIKYTSDFSKDAATTFANETIKLESLYTVSTNVNASMEDRLQAAKTLKSEYPDLLALYSEEQITLGEAETAYRLLTNTIWQYAQAKAAEKRLEELATKQIDLNVKKTKAQTDQKERDIKGLKTVNYLMYNNLTLGEQFNKFVNDLPQNGAFGPMVNSLQAMKKSSDVLYDIEQQQVAINDEVSIYKGIINENINAEDRLAKFKADEFSKEQERQKRLALSKSKKIDTSSLDVLKKQQKYYKDDLDMFYYYGSLIIEEQKRLALQKAKIDGASAIELANIEKAFELDMLINKQEFGRAIMDIADKNTKEVEKIEKDSNDRQLAEAKRIAEKIASIQLNTRFDIASAISSINDKFASEDIKNNNIRLSATLKATRGNYNAQKEAILEAIAVNEAYKKSAEEAGYGTRLFEEAGKNLEAQLDGLVDPLEQLNQSLKSSFDQLNLDLLVNFSEQLGEMMAGGKFDFTKLGTILADALSSIGKALIAFALTNGAAAELFKNPATWPLALVAGIASVAAGTALKSKLSNNQTTAFANGGIVSGPTMGLVGEYPGAQNNPEVIAPLDKLKSMIGGGGSGTFVLRGQDLLLSVNRAQKASNLKGQNISLA